MQILRRFTQIFFLAIFITLMITGKAQFWMAFIFASIILATFFGRYYCGWACPINTLITPVDKLSRVLGLHRKTPAAIKSGVFRIIVFIIFLCGLGYTIYTITQGRKFPLPLIIIPFGLIVTLFINPTAWHRYLCPWGTFFSLTARFSKFGVRAGTCTGCQACKAQCPTESISYSKTATIIPTNCLLCRKCSSACPNNALKYSRI